MERLESGFKDATTVVNLPEPYRRRLRSTNGLERLNLGIRRREQIIRIFPNSEATLRLLGAVLMEQDEAWSTGRKYFDMAAYWELRTKQEREAATKAAGEASKVA